MNRFDKYFRSLGPILDVSTGSNKRFNNTQKCVIAPLNNVFAGCWIYNNTNLPPVQYLGNVKLFGNNFFWQGSTKVMGHGQWYGFACIESVTINPISLLQFYNLAIERTELKELIIPKFCTYRPKKLLI